MKEPLSVIEAIRPTKIYSLSLALLGAALALAGCSAPTAAPATSTPPATATSGTPAPVTSQPIAGGPVLLRSDMSLRKVTNAGGGAAKLALNPADGKLYFLM